MLLWVRFLSLPKALAAVLQLGVTMDYSIFLMGTAIRNRKASIRMTINKAMAVAIGNTITSVVGSSITTVAGFIALCFMTFTLGLDLGIVMAKGVVIGVIGCVTILPSMILTFDRALEKTMHKEIMPAKFDKLANFRCQPRMASDYRFPCIIIPGNLRI